MKLMKLTSACKVTKMLQTYRVTFSMTATFRKKPRVIAVYFGVKGLPLVENNRSTSKEDTVY